MKEEQFLKEYDSSIFEKLSVTTDIVVFSVSTVEKENYRKLSEKKLSVLLVKRDNFPFKDKWCLPGGFVDIKETLLESANRILLRETNLKDIYLEQLYTFSSVDRDPRLRVLSTAYVALIDKNRCLDELNSQASWFHLTYEIENDIVTFFLKNDNETLSFSCKKENQDFTILSNDSLAFDHPLAITYGISRIKNKITYTDIAFNLMSKEFTLGELQQVYEVILGKKLLDPAFRRIIADKVIKTNHVQKGGGHRPSVLFQMKKNNIPKNIL